MNGNIVAYRELETELASKLEAQYQYLMICGQVQEAYQILGKLMAYKLITKFDERLSEKNKTFKKAGIDTTSRFRLDLRKDTNYIPEWLFADIPYYFNSKLTINAHTGERRDFGYVVDIVLPEREVDVEFRLLNTSMGAKNTVADLAVAYKEENGKNLNISSITEEIEVGYSRIYDIKINSTVLTKYKTLGYVLVYRSHKDGLFYAKMLLKSKALKNTFIDIFSACKILGNAVADNLGLGGNLKVGFLSDYRKVIEEQKVLMVETRDKLNKIKLAKEDTTAEIKELNRQNNKK